ncbi:MAG: nitroreductase [Pseudomonadota bacterium]
MPPFDTPAFGAPTPACHPCDEALRLLAARRSTAADFLSGPGPDAEILETILEIAARVPDHRRVVPFRFIVFEDAARTRFGDVLADAFRAQQPDADEVRVEKERARFERAPVVVAVVSSVDKAHRTPEWEQVLTAGAVCQNMLVAANASGFASQWLTEWYAYDQAVLGALGLAENERIAGYVYIGTATEPPKERARPDMAALKSAY